MQTHPTSSLYSHRPRLVLAELRRRMCNVAPPCSELLNHHSVEVVLREHSFSADVAVVALDTRDCVLLIVFPSSANILIIAFSSALGTVSPRICATFWSSSTSSTSS